MGIGELSDLPKACSLPSLTTPPPSLFLFSLSMPGMHAAGGFVSALAAKLPRPTPTLPRMLVAIPSRAMSSGIPREWYYGPR